MELILIRHGRTEANEKKIYASHREALNAQGRAQVEVLREHMEDKYPVYTSPYHRCQETAELLFPGEKIIVKEDLREMSFGRLEGYRFDEYYAKDPKGLSLWMEDPFQFGPPEGESINQAYDRVSNYIKSIEESSILVTHDGFIRLALCALLGSSKYFFNFHIENASKVIIRKIENQYVIAGINLK